MGVGGERGGSVYCPDVSTMIEWDGKEILHTGDVKMMSEEARCSRISQRMHCGLCGKGFWVGII